MMSRAYRIVAPKNLVGLIMIHRKARVIPTLAMPLASRCFLLLRLVCVCVCASLTCYSARSCSSAGAVSSSVGQLTGGILVDRVGPMVCRCAHRFPVGLRRFLATYSIRLWYRTSCVDFVFVQHDHVCDCLGSAGVF